jgi:NADP-dependent 3-hydroxy acid dehydrogenase YdfG
MQMYDKVAIITGASSGIGRATAHALSAAGMKLVLTARRGKELEKLAAELPGQSVCVDADIVEPGTAPLLVDTAVQRFGSCDVVFANAGIMNIGSIEDADIDALCDMVRVNIDAVVRVAYAALPQMKKQGRGDLIITSSILGQKTRPTVGVYSGTKYAVEAMTESLRMEMAGTGVRVMTIEPGFTTTDLQSHWTRQQREPLKAIPRPLRPEDIARSVRFMISQPDHVTIPKMLVMPADHAL